MFVLLEDPFSNEDLVVKSGVTLGSFPAHPESCLTSKGKIFKDWCFFISKNNYKGCLPITYLELIGTSAELNSPHLVFHFKLDFLLIILYLCRVQDFSPGWAVHPVHDLFYKFGWPQLREKKKSSL